MIDDTASGTRRVSEPVFFSAVVLGTLLVVVGSAFFLLRPGDSAGTPPLASNPGAHQSPPQQPSSPDAEPARPPRAGAVAVVDKYFRLSLAGEFAASCALESRAYLEFDARHYSHGSCAAESRAVAETLASQGLSMELTSTKVASYDGDRATILTETTVGTRVVTQNVYVRYRGGRWWITGSDDSGDLGF